MKKIALYASLLLLVISGSLKSQETLSKYKYIGEENAPVVIYEFSALSCVFCSDFNKSTKKDLIKDYVNKGIAKIVFVDVPLNNADLYAHSLAHYMKNNEEFFKIADILLSNQQSWVAADNYQSVINGYFRLAGMSNEDIEKAQNDAELKDWLLTNSQELMKKTGITGTPSIVITKNGEKIESGKVLPGLTPYKTIKDSIETLL